MKITEVVNSDCWEPSASEGPQKRDLTMFLSMRAGIFGIRLRVYRSMVKTKFD
jgi:hypothetical protein